jgi:2,3-dihydroxy-p-cumate/2,3-dihydroxybenzoate 3,4-dioxygenase
MSARIVGLAYVRVAAGNPAAQAKFAADVVGLQVGEAGDQTCALRCDARARSLVFSRILPTALALEAWDDAALQRLADSLTAAGFEPSLLTPEDARERRVRAGLSVRDPSGNLVEIVAGPEHSGRRFFPGRDAGVTGLANIGLRSRDVSSDLRFWRVLNAAPRDYAGAVVYLALDDAHHRIALYPSQDQGPLYVAFSVDSFDDLMRSQYFLAERQIKIVQGPGRQPAAEQAFLHFRAPDGLIYSFVHGMSRPGAEQRPPRQYPAGAEGLCAWGSRADGVAELSAEEVDP